MSKNLQNSLFQKRAWHGVNHLTLCDARALKIQKTSKRKTISYMIDIIALDSVSRRVYGIAWGWLTATVIFSILAYVAITFPELLAGLKQHYSIGLTALAIIGTIGCFILLWLSSSRKQVFYTRHGRIPLFEIWVGQPTGKAFRAYVKLLKESIQQVQEKSSLTSEQQLSGEMRMLRRLVDESVINKDVYEKAKAGLFKKF